MPRLSITILVGLLAVAPSRLHAEGDAGPSEIQLFLTTYCNDCHGAEEQKSDRRFDQLALPASNVDDLINLDDILEQIHLGDMPPKKAPQPSAEEQEAFIEQIVAGMPEKEYGLRSLIEDVVTSELFLSR